MKSPLLLIFLVLTATLRAAEPSDDAYRPHTPTLTFHLTHADDPTDAEAIRASVQRLASVSKVTFAPGAVQVRFDSHVVSYHQIAQAIADAGKARGKQFDPSLKLLVPEYAQDGNGAKVDAVLAGKRLNQRVRHHRHPASELRSRRGEATARRERPHRLRGA